MRRAAILACLAAVLAAPASAGARITVFAAASLTDVFPAVDRSPRYSFAGSDALALQIEQGAPADVFAAAGTKQPAELYARGLVYKPLVFATNRLVLIVPRSNPAGIRSVFDLRRHGVKLVIAQAGVPAGDYTRKLLAGLGLSSVLDNVVSEETDVRNVVAKVVLGEADAGFVYATDARAAAPKATALALPARAQPRIRYELAIVRSTRHFAQARAFVRRVVGKRGRAALHRYGFGLP